ncbi:MAG: membrane protein insertion efficiency factor YidD [FCB group bacterium]|nr:membrane protein insertion efficiency factor YidD [FCB group bacterium]
MSALSQLQVYGARAVTRYGLVRGSVIAADRIVRCNPAARFYQVRAGRSFHEPDGRVIDPVVPDRAETKRHSPALAAALSAVVPGAGRVYAGRSFDGLMGFLTVALYYSMAKESTARGHPIRAGILWTGTVTFYLGEIYGAWRSAKYD